MWEQFGLDPIDDDADALALYNLSNGETVCRGYLTSKAIQKPISDRFELMIDYVPSIYNSDISGPSGQIFKRQLVAYLGLAKDEDKDKTTENLWFPALVVDVDPTISPGMQRVTSIYDNDFDPLYLTEVDRADAELLETLRSRGVLSSQKEDRLFRLWTDFD
jgi:hypothetical protein